MRVISKTKIEEYFSKLPKSEEALLRWYRLTRKAEWKSFADVKDTHPAVDVYGTCHIFDIAGNHWRLIAKIHFPKLNEETGLWSQGRVYIRTIMTHAEYMQNKWKRDCGA